jgi:ABC-2 type transport system ATP-binding protein
MSDFVVEMNNVRKSFRKTEALCGLNLQVPAGSIYGLLGRNGAGKTTAIKLLMGMLKADSGDARVFGLPVADTAEGIEIRRRIGFVAEEKELYPYMTVDQMIRFTRPFFQKWRKDLEQRYLKMFDLPSDRKIPKLSKGMRSKLMLLLALCRGAELLILDEPMEGLDPSANEDVLRELVDLAAAEGTTIFFSSHQIADVEQIADRVSIIDHGISLLADRLDAMKDRYQRIQIVFPDGVPSSIQWVDGVEQLRQDGRMVSILAGRNQEAILAQGRSFPGASVESFPLTLKEIFLGHVGSH